MKRLLLIIWIVAAGMSLSGCAAVKLGSMPKPPETARLRVALIPLSETVSRGKWGKNDEEFADNLYRFTRKVLDKRGYYEVVPETEMKAVLGEYVPDRWSLIRKDAELAHRVGAALYADYVLLAERGTLGDPFYYFELTLINIDTGRRFIVRINNTRIRGGKKLPDGTGKVAIRELFRDAKGDLLGTALHKTRAVPGPDTGEHRRQEESSRLRLEKEKSPREKSEPEKPLQAASAEAKLNADKTAGVIAPRQPEEEHRNHEQLERLKADEQKPAVAGSDENITREVGYLDAEQQEDGQVRDAKRLIVYDLATASETYRQVALILSEALREEIQKRGVYNLVNRENIQLLLSEMKFQESGLIDSAQAVQLGKGAGAQEIVTGNLGVLGRTVVLQSKRTEIQTMLNLAQASLKSDAGQEELLLARLADMVDQLLPRK